MNHNHNMINEEDITTHYLSMLKLFAELLPERNIEMKTNKSSTYTLSSKSGFSVLIEMDIDEEESKKILEHKVREILIAKKEIKKYFIMGCFDGRSSWDKSSHYLSVDIDRDYDKQDLVAAIIESMDIDVNKNRRIPTHPKNDQLRIKKSSVERYVSNIGFLSNYRKTIVQKSLNI